MSETTSVAAGVSYVRNIDSVDAVLAAFARLAPKQQAQFIARALAPDFGKHARDDALRAAVKLCWRRSVSASCKELPSRLGSYVTREWLADQQRGAAPDDCGALRALMFRIVWLNGGDGLAWRQIVRVAEQE